jgi:uncharacterized protein YjiS (DUF1127 family)
MVSLENGMFGFLAQVLDDLARERRRQSAVRELGKLSDHQLADIGLRREQLSTVALDLADEKERDRVLAPALWAELQVCG